jgi:hypothetical protein
MFGDKAAVYAFGLAPFDADPPQIVSPMLSIPNSAGKPALMRLDADKPLLVPGRTPVELVTEIRDIGSGVNPDSIEVFLKGNPLPKSAIAPFADSTGRLLVTLAAPKGKATLILEDGLFDIQIIASDYRGNKMSYKGNFLVDNTVPPPAAPARTDDDNG